MRFKLESGFASRRKQASLGAVVGAATVALCLIATASSRANDDVSPGPRPTPTTFPSALQAFANAWDGVWAYHAKVSVYAVKGSAVQNVVFDYSFRKPSSFTVHVIEGPNAGATLTWDGGPNVQATRGRGLFALFKRTIPLHDPLVTTIRGASIDQLSYGAILAHAQQTPGTLAQVAGELIGGTETQALSLVPSDPAADAGLTREIILISSVTQLPVRIEGYEGTMLVRKIDFTDVQPDQ